jgi:hypothetical protein
MWARLLVVATTVAGASACIIGPKQDDPESLVDPKRQPDTGTFSDSGVASPEDTSPALFADSAPSPDAVASSDAGPPPKTDGGCVTDAADADDADETHCDAGGGSDALSAD